MFYELLLPLFSVDLGFGETTEPGDAQDKQTTDLPKHPGSFDEDIRSLEKSLGPLESGQEINLTLQEILRICPRARKRTDAYRKLTSELDKRLGIKLIITSQKGRKNV